MRPSPPFALPALAPALALALALTASPRPLRAQEAAAAPDWEALAGTFPAPGSEAWRGELAVLMWTQQARTRRDEARVASEGTVDLGCFMDLIPGLPRRKEDLRRPLTQALMDHARQDLLQVVRTLKEHHRRPRPAATHGAVRPVPGATAHAAASFPSEHGAQAVLQASILAQFAPGCREALLERGKVLGTDRVVGGLAWPSDVTSGRRLGQAFATWWINDPAHRQLIQEACRAEWHGGVQGPAQAPGGPAPAPDDPAPAPGEGDAGLGLWAW